LPNRVSHCENRLVLLLRTRQLRALSALGVSEALAWGMSEPR
jgi:hypothetical protein